MASSRQRKGSGRSTSSGPIAKPLRPWTLDHFRRWTEYLVWEGNQHHALAEFQYDIFADIVAGFREIWQIIPEGNGKSTFSGILALYGADFSDSPWIPVGAASAKQARIVYQQAEGFVERTPDLQGRFRCFGGYKLIRSLANGGVGIEVFAHDPKTGDGVIPYPFAIVDELHRHDDLRLYGLWKGKLRKRGAQILTISTAGEPETPFENTRDEIRRQATKTKRKGSHLRAESANIVLHEWMVPDDESCLDMKAVKAANPLSTITIEALTEDFKSSTTDLGDWKRFKCNRPTRSAQSAITDAEWDKAQTKEKFPASAPVILGFDVAFKWDTTAIVPLHKTEKRLLLGPASIRTPPRDGSSMHPDEIKEAILEIENPVEAVVMDTSHAEDIGAWLEDEMGFEVVDQPQGNKLKVAEYEAFMQALRQSELRHTGCPNLRAHVLNAIARRLPGGDFRFDRPSTVRQNPRAQDRRVIDALSAASMAVEFAGRQGPPRRSVYEDRDLVAA
jgi:phage terminase large subunit-like protein